MLILAQNLHKKSCGNVLAGCTNGQPNSVMLKWFAEHPEYEYLLIPDPADAGGTWREALATSIRKGKGRFRTEKTPDELSPQHAVLAGW